MYKPNTAPSISGNPDLSRVVKWVDEELNQLARQYAVNGVLLRELHAEPIRPREGLLVLADGTDWNPGSGAGLYLFYGGIWNNVW